MFFLKKNVIFVKNGINYFYYTTKNNNSSADLQTFSQLLGNKYYRIPDFQRRYSWTHQQNKELFDDL